MSFSESIDLNVTSHSSGAAEDLRKLGDAAKEAADEVEKLDATDVDIAIDDAQLPSVKEALEEIRDQADKLDAEEVTVDVDVTGADAAAGSLDRVHQSGAATKGVMANLTGNAAQDLAALTGVGGSAGVALGQLAERAADGNVNLRQMGGAVAGIAAIGVALEYTRGMMDALKAADAFDDDRIETYKDALLEGASAVEAITAALTEAEGVSVRVFGEAGIAGGLKGIFGIGDGSVIEDATDDVLALGLNVQTFSELAASGKTEIDAWAAAMREGGADGAKLNTVVMALWQESARLEEAAKNAATTQKFLGNEAATATPKMDAYAAAVRNAVEAVLALNSLKTSVVGAAGADASDAPFSSARARRGEGVTNVYNYHPAAPTPNQVALAEQEYRRIQEGPG